LWQSHHPHKVAQTVSSTVAGTKFTPA